MHFKHTLIVAIFISLMINEKTLSVDVDSTLEVSPLQVGETLTFNSSVLEEQRQLNVFLPANYNESKDKTYPVIYLLDGSVKEDLFHVAGIVQFGSFPWLNFIPESIVIGVENVDRKRDFTFKSSDPLDQKEAPTSGGADEFIKFLQSEVQPLVNQQYRTTNESTVIGQSLGGLLVTQVLFESPDLFNNYVIVSPSLWWDKESLLSRSIEISQQELNIYIAVGGEGSTMVRLATTLADKLNHAYKSKEATSFNYFEQLNHGDALHLAAYEGLKLIFSKEKEKENEK